MNTDQPGRWFETGRGDWSGSNIGIWQERERERATGRESKQESAREREFVSVICLCCGPLQRIRRLREMEKRDVDGLANIGSQPLKRRLMERMKNSLTNQTGRGSDCVPPNLFIPLVMVF